MINSTHTLPALPTPTSSMAGLHTLLRSFETVLLATLDRLAGDTAQHLNTRLMSVAGVDDDCTLSFFTAARLDDGHGHVIAQAKTCSINLTGNFQVSRQRAQMAPLFGEHHVSWFPRGLDEPGLCLITFKPQAAELRDMGRVQRIPLTDDPRAAPPTQPAVVLRASSLALAAWTRVKRRAPRHN